MARNHFRSLTFTVLIASSALSVAQSQPPSQTPAESGQPAQTQAAEDRHQPAGNSAAPAVQRNTEERAEVARQPADDKPSADWWMVWLTGGLLVIAAAQVFAFVQQLRLMRGALHEASVSAEAAKVSADAAKMGAEATIALERPWLVVESSGVPEEDDTWAPGEIVFRIRYRLANLGRSPAWCEGWTISCFCVLNSEQEVFPYRADSFWPREPLAPGASRVDDETVWLTPDERDDMMQGRAVILVFGRIRYRDALGRDHETGFSWSYMRPDLNSGRSWNAIPWIVTHGRPEYVRIT